MLLKPELDHVTQGYPDGHSARQILKNQELFHVLVNKQKDIENHFLEDSSKTLKTRKKKTAQLKKKKAE